MAASVASRSRFGSSPGRAVPCLHGCRDPWTEPAAAVRLHPSSVASQRGQSPVTRIDPFSARSSLGAGLPDVYRLEAVADRLDLDTAPVTIKILLENLLRHAGGGVVTEADVTTLTAWRPGQPAEAEIPFMPSRVILQDFTGVPAIVDLAVMRDAMADLGGDPAAVNPLVPADLVIDHSVQVDRFGTPGVLRVQRRARVRAERRALPAPALGPDRVPGSAGRAARHRHRPPGQPRVPGDGRDRPRGRRRRPGRLSGHARRHGLPHDDDQRPRACWATASVASRPRPSCWASRSTSRCRMSWASA